MSQRVETRLFQSDKIPIGQLFLLTAVAALEAEQQGKTEKYIVQYLPGTLRVSVPVVVRSEPIVEQRQIQTRYELTD